jgi:hypothetical protein
MANCYNMQCPCCSSGDWLRVTCTTEVLLGDFGYHVDADCEWGRDSDVRCGMCQWDGRVGDLIVFTPVVTPKGWDEV